MISRARAMKCPNCGGVDFKENKKSWRCNFCRIRIVKIQEEGET